MSRFVVIFICNSKSARGTTLLFCFRDEQMELPDMKVLSEFVKKGYIIINV